MGSNINKRSAVIWKEEEFIIKLLVKLVFHLWFPLLLDLIHRDKASIEYIILIFTKVLNLYFFIKAIDRRKMVNGFVLAP